MKRFAFIFLGILAVLLIAAFTVPFLIPNEVYKNQIESAATKTLQRDVVLNGDVSISVFPRLSASVENVTVANPDGFEEPHMISAGALRGSVKWLPLLGRKVDIHELAFVDADVKLRRLADGRPNWEFGSDNADESTEPSPKSSNVQAAIEAARLQNASLSFQDDTSGAFYELKDFNLKASLQAMDKPLEADGDGVFQNETFDFNLTLDSPAAATSGELAALDIQFKSSLGNGRYDGNLRLGEIPALDGAFEFDARSLEALVRFAALDLPVRAAALGEVSAKGSVTGELSALEIDFEDARQSSELANSSYTGKLSLAEPLSMNGKVQADISDASAFASSLGMDLPAAKALGDVDLSANLSGPVSALRMTGVSFTQNGALLDASYSGSAQLGGAGQMAGQVKVSSERLRDLLTALDVKIPEGETLKAFDLSTALSGSFKTISLQGLTFRLDDIAGSGNAGLDLSGDTPSVSAALETNDLDLTPFLGAPRQEAAPVGWSKEPLDLAGLKVVNADIDLSTPSLKIGDVVLSDAAIAAELRGGRLVADLTRFNAFNGAWSGKMILNGQDTTPLLSFNMTGQNVGVSDLLGTLASFDKLTGTGNFQITASSRGTSIDAIMNALDGTVKTDLGNGALKGINVGQLVRSAGSLREAMASGQLQRMDFSNVLSPSAETDFTTFETALTIKDGKATVDLLKLINPVLGMDGSGQIDLGGRALDLRLATSIDETGAGEGAVVQLNGIPVPVRISGPWTNLKVSPDLSGIQAALRSELEGQVRDEINLRLGDQLPAGVLSDVLGAGGTRQPTAAPETDAAQEDEAEAGANTEEEEDAEPESLENAAERAAQNALRDLLKPRETEQPEE